MGTKVTKDGKSLRKQERIQDHTSHSWRMICALSEYGCVGICDSCGSSNCQDGFYIAVLNCWYCSDCFHKWYARAKCYASDEYVENKNFELYKAVLGIY